jgi:hypothetical protein
MPDPNHVIFHEHQVAWFGLCKNANSSIKRAFFESMGLFPEKEHASGLLNYATKQQIDQSPFWSFAVVRNPINRAVSCWKNKCFKSWRAEYGQRFKIYQRMPFDAFVEAIHAVPDHEATGAGQHFRGQFYDISIGGRLIPDHIGRFEQIEETWQEVQERSSIPLPDLKHFNKSVKDNPPMSNATIELLRERYAADFEAFAY